MWVRIETEHAEKTGIDFGKKLGVVFIIKIVVSINRFDLALTAKLEALGTKQLIFKPLYY